METNKTNDTDRIGKIVQVIGQEIAAVAGIQINGESLRDVCNAVVM